jgi:hypothetical protein
MSTKGKHSGTTGTFYRDLAMMAAGIVLVGAAVFFLLVLLADNPEDSTTTTAVAVGSTTSTAGEATTSTSGGDDTTSTSAPATSTTSTTIPVRPPEEVRVIVLNSVGIPGAAGRMSTVLADAGYQMLQPTDYSPELDPSRLWFREGFSAEANALLEFLPSAVVEPLPDESLAEGADVIMVLGTGYEE